VPLHEADRRPLAFLRNLWEHFPKGAAFGGKKIHQQRNILFTESQDQRSRAFM
jgi:hypothetical protein